jgi:hypothetical protein
VTYKEDGTTPTNTFSVGETIIVKATAAFPANNAIMAAARFDTPAGEQMAVYYNDTQISAPSTVENGVHTMTVDTGNLPESALNKEIGLTVKYIESDNASGADTEAKVTVTAAARVGKYQYFRRCEGGEVRLYHLCGRFGRCVHRRKLRRYSNPAVGGGFRQQLH